MSSFTFIFHKSHPFLVPISINIWKTICIISSLYITNTLLLMNVLTLSDLLPSTPDLYQGGYWQGCISLARFFMYRSYGARISFNQPPHSSINLIWYLSVLTPVIKQTFFTKLIGMKGNIGTKLSSLWGNIRGI